MIPLFRYSGYPETGNSWIYPEDYVVCGKRHEEDYFTGTTSLANRQTTPEVTMLREIFEILLAIIVIWLIWKFIQRYLML